MESTDLTSSQANFLKQCEEEFKDRYTDKDEAFMKVKKADPKKPPIIDPWHNKPRRPQHSWSRQNYGHNRHNSWDRRHDRNERNDRSERAERHAGKHLYQRHSRPY